jgi:hypothetical protein
MMPDADRGNAPRSALSTSRTPGRSVGSSDPVHDPRGQTPRDDFGRNAGRDVLGSSAVIRHRARAGRSVLPFGGAPGRPGRVPGGAADGRTSKGTQAHGRNERSRRPQGCRTQRTRSRSNASKSRGSIAQTPLPPTGNGERGVSPPGGVFNGREAVQAVVTPHGCERGELFEGSKRRGERGLPHPGPTAASGRPAHPRGGRSDRGSGSCETRRTPGPVAGCNKPAVLRAEQAVEVVRNHEGGTRCWTGGAVGPRLFGATGVGSRERPGAGSGRALDVSVEGQRGHEPQERQGPGPASPRGGAEGSALRRRSPARDLATVRALRRRRAKVRECRRGAVRRSEATPR